MWCLTFFTGKTWDFWSFTVLGGLKRMPGNRKHQVQETPLDLSTNHGEQFPKIDIPKTPMWVFPKTGVPPKSSILIGVFPYKPSFFGVALFLETPVFFLHFLHPAYHLTVVFQVHPSPDPEFPSGYIDLRNIGTKVHPMWLQLWFSDLPKKSWAWLKKRWWKKTNKSLQITFLFEKSTTKPLEFSTPNVSC